MPERPARFALPLLTAALLVGTLMPGSWKGALTPNVHAPIDLSVMAHMTLFAGICIMLPAARLWKLAPWHLPVLALALALLTEGLQFFAVGRHPSLVDACYDMAGAFVGWGTGHLLQRVRAAAPLSVG